jgi:xylulokinase
MTERELCLSVDLGTGGPKVALVTFDGEIVAHEIHQVPTVFSDDGGAVQDAELWWSIICEATTRLLAHPEVTSNQVKAVCVTGQYASTVPVDENGLPTGPCLTWLDTRGVRLNREAVGGPVQGYSPAKALRFIRKSAGAPSLNGGDPVGHILYLMSEEPEIVARTRWFMEPVDYLTMRFSGVASATHASHMALWMTDNRTLARYDYDAELLASVGLTRDRLPPLVPIGSVIGNVSKEVATQLGLSRDTQVVTGLPDLHAAAVGSGGTALYATHLALSTTSWISCPVPKKKTDIAHSIAAVPGLTNDTYLVINNQETGAKALEWLQGALAGTGEAMSFPVMTALAATSPPGANGVIFTPWLTGERSPVDDKRARAGFTNLSMTSCTADLIRAVMEGVAANSNWLFRYVEKFTGTMLSPVRLVGGGAQSDLWCQIYADTLGREVEQVRDPMVAQIRGMALFSSVSLGRRTWSDLAALHVPGRIFRPDPRTAASYLARKNELASLYHRDRRWRRAQR